MRVYTLTKLGKRVYKEGSCGTEEMRVLNFLRENRSASDDQLEIAGSERYVIRRMKQRGLIRELTT